jgi:hypothetical protein
MPIGGGSNWFGIEYVMLAVFSLGVLLEYHSIVYMYTISCTNVILASMSLL